MSLAEVLFAMGLICAFMLAIVMVVIKGMDLNRRDAIITQSTMYCNEVLEQDARIAGDPRTFGNLVSLPLKGFLNQQEFIYSQAVTPYNTTLTLGPTSVVITEFKKVTVAIYYQDPAFNITTHPAPDPRRGNSGQVVQMSALYAKPNAAHSGP